MASATTRVSRDLIHHPFETRKEERPAYPVAAPRDQRLRLEEQHQARGSGERLVLRRLGDRLLAPVVVTFDVEFERLGPLVVHTGRDQAVLGLEIGGRLLIAGGF